MAEGAQAAVEPCRNVEPCAEHPRVLPQAETPADEQVEAELRCKACNKLVTKIFVTVDTPGPGGRQKVVKVGFETRCPRCKEFIYHLFVA